MAEQVGGAMCRSTTLTHMQHQEAAAAKAYIAIQEVADIL